MVYTYTVGLQGKEREQKGRLKRQVKKTGKKRVRKNVRKEEVLTIDCTFRRALTGFVELDIPTTAR
jgi:hypothetical protein